MFTQALIRTTGSMREGWLPFNQIGACVPQWLTSTFLVGIFPPTKLVKRYHPALRSLSQSGIWPDVHLACTLLRELSSSMWFPLVQQLLQTSWADAAWVKARARMTNLRGNQRVLIFYWDAVSVASCLASNGFQYKSSISVSVCTGPILKRWKGTNVARERCYATLPWYVYRINSRMRALKRGQKVRQERKSHASEAFFNKCRTKILTLTRSLKSGQGSDRREKNSK